MGPGFEMERKRRLLEANESNLPFCTPSRTVYKQNTPPRRWYATSDDEAIRSESAGAPRKMPETTRFEDPN